MSRCASWVLIGVGSRRPSASQAIDLPGGGGVILGRLFTLQPHFFGSAVAVILNFAALKSLGRSGRPSFSGSLQGRDVGQSGFECELALFGAEADAFSTYERGVTDADEPEETRQECFLMFHTGNRRRGGVESTAGRGDDQLLTARETLHAGRGVLERLAGRGKAINPGL